MLLVSNQPGRHTTDLELDGMHADICPFVSIQHARMIRIDRTYGLSAHARGNAQFQTTKNHMLHVLVANGKKQVPVQPAPQRQSVRAITRRAAV